MTTKPSLRMLITLLFCCVAQIGWSHCDSMDGPVVIEAKAALERGDPTPVLKWVTAEQESEVRAVFSKTLAVRTTSDTAREVADQYFLETLVRLHRAGEGAPYTGLKAAGGQPQFVLAAEHALDSKSVDNLSRHLTSAIASDLKRLFDAAVAAKKHSTESVESGRSFVAAYVEYFHYVEKLHSMLGTHTKSGKSCDQH